jgi:hypothetical protein
VRESRTDRHVSSEQALTGGNIVGSSTLKERLCQRDTAELKSSIDCLSVGQAFACGNIIGFYVSK